MEQFPDTLSTRLWELIQFIRKKFHSHKNNNMQTKINEALAFKIYHKSSQTLKRDLEEIFGSDFFKSRNITEIVQSFDGILFLSGRTMDSLISPGDKPHHIAGKQIELIAEVYNEGTVLDPMNENQWKYYPVHRIDKSSGSGLSFRVYDAWSSLSTVGVRRCFKSEELAIDAGKKFVDIYATANLK